MIWGGSQCRGGGPVGERSALMGAAPLPLLSCPRKMRNASRAEKVESKWLKGGFLT